MTKPNSTVNVEILGKEYLVAVEGRVPSKQPVFCWCSGEQIGGFSSSYTHKIYKRVKATSNTLDFSIQSFQSSAGSFLVKSVSVVELSSIPVWNPNRIANPDFDGTTGWSAINCSLTTDPSGITVTNTATNGSIRHSFNADFVGQEFIVDIYQRSSAIVTAHFTTTGDTGGTVKTFVGVRGRNSFTVTATKVGTNYLALYCIGASGTVHNIKKVSVKPLPTSIWSTISDGTVEWRLHGNQLYTLRGLYSGNSHTNHAQHSEELVTGQTTVGVAITTVTQDSPNTLSPNGTKTSTSLDYENTAGGYAFFRGRSYPVVQDEYAYFHTFVKEGLDGYPFIRSAGTGADTCATFDFETEQFCFVADDVVRTYIRKLGDGWYCIGALSKVQETTANYLNSGLSNSVVGNESISPASAWNDALVYLWGYFADYSVASDYMMPQHIKTTGSTATVNADTFLYDGTKCLGSSKQGVLYATSDRTMRLFPRSIMISKGGEGNSVGIGVWSGYTTFKYDSASQGIIYNATPFGYYQDQEVLGTTFNPYIGYAAQYGLSTSPIKRNEPYMDYDVISIGTNGGAGGHAMDGCVINVGYQTKQISEQEVKILTKRENSND